MAENMHRNSMETGKNGEAEKAEVAQYQALHAGLLLRDRYEIVRLLGCGAFAETYLAKDRQSGKHVAIKAFHPEKMESWKTYDLFTREVKALQSLKHPGIPAIYDYFEEKVLFQTSFIVMEYIEGELLQDMIARNHRLDPADLIGLFLKLLEILEYLHSCIPPVLHRDIKPANIMIRPDGSPVLIDFGSVRTIFKAPDEHGSTIIGTFGYMPYEQYMGQASPASDIYALAASILEIVTGRPPSDFVNGNGEIIIPDDINIPLLLKELLHCMLLPSVSQRIQTVKEVKKRLFAPIVGHSQAGLERSNAQTRKALSTQKEMTTPIEQLSVEKLDRMLAYARQHYMPDVKQIMSINSQGELPDDPGPGQLALIYGLGTLTLGLWPLGTWLYQQTLFRKYKPIFERGKLALGSIDTIFFIQNQNTSTYPKYKVMYNFEADGQLHKNALLLRPNLAQFWKENMPIYVLYLPDENYRSIIIGEA